MVEVWEYHKEILEEACYTGKSKIIVQAPVELVAILVCRPEHKVKWEALTKTAEMVKEFSKDFFVAHLTYKTVAINYNRDCVVGYLTTEHAGRVCVVARSVPYGDVPLPKVCLLVLCLVLLRVS